MTTGGDAEVRERAGVPQRHLLAVHSTADALAGHGFEVLRIGAFLTMAGLGMFVWPGLLTWALMSSVRSPSPCGSSRLFRCPQQRAA
jgi:hypothetical protein